MAIEEGDENRLNGITSVIESDDTIEASSNPTAPLLDAGKQSDSKFVNRFLVFFNVFKYLFSCFN